MARTATVRTGSFEESGGRATLATSVRGFDGSGSDSSAVEPLQTLLAGVDASLPVPTSKICATAPSSVKGNAA